MPEEREANGLFCDLQTEAAVMGDGGDVLELLGVAAGTQPS